MDADDPDAASERSFFLELERAAKALTVADSKADAHRLRGLFETMQRRGRGAGETPGPAGG